jgi:hypothetical protein
LLLRQLPRAQLSTTLERLRAQPGKVIEHRVYQAIVTTGRFCAELGVSGALSFVPKLRFGISALALTFACAETTPTLTPAEAGHAKPGLTHLTYTPRHGHTLHLTDRLALFDKVGFSWPSAIMHDAVHDVYWVSNLNLDGPAGAGFISRLQPDGSLSTLNFIDGRREGVKLMSPHGLAVSGDTLLVADVGAIRKFDTTSGEPKESIAIPGTRYLSDVAAAPDGTLYVVDVGSDPNVAAVPNEGTDAVYRISSSGEVSVIARRPDLGGPVALLADGTGLWIACTGSADLLLLVPTAGGESQDAGRLHLPGESPRGIAAMPDGTLLISSWTARAVFRGFRDGPFQPVITGLESPADLDYDARRKRLLIPLLTGHALAIFQLDPLASTARPKSGP